MEQKNSDLNMKDSYENYAIKASFPRSRVNLFNQYFGITLGLISIIVFIFSKNAYDFPIFLIGFVVFLLIQAASIDSRLDVYSIFSPKNIAAIIFTIQMIGVPLLIICFGYSADKYPWLSDDYSVNFAYGINIISYTVYSISLGFFSKYKKRPRNDLSLNIHFFNKTSKLFIVLYGILGILGFFLIFGDPGGFISYVTNPNSERNTDVFVNAVGLLLRPFLGVSVVLAWSFWIKNKRKYSQTVLLSIFFCFLILLINYNYNRGFMIAPALAFIGAFSVKVRKISILSLVLIASLLIFLAMFIGSYRNKSFFSVTEKLTSQTIVDYSDYIQLYANGPQFTGFLIKQTNYGENLYWGKTLLPSIIYPVPILGKPFRDQSGVVIYNRLFYGMFSVNLDAIIPFQGEIFINFHIPGLIISFILIGYLITRIESAFIHSSNSFEAYSFCLIGLWFATIIIWSISILSQIFGIFFWPIYIYFFLKRTRILRGARFN